MACNEWDYAGVRHNANSIRLCFQEPDFAGMDFDRLLATCMYRGKCLQSSVVLRSKLTVAYGMIDHSVPPFIFL